MFTTPMYNSLLIDQSLALNRRRDEDSIEVDGLETSETDLGYTNLTSKGDKEESSQIHKSDTVPRIIGCATMWHETRVSAKITLKLTEFLNTLSKSLIVILLFRKK